MSSERSWALAAGCHPGGQSLQALGNSDVTLARIEITDHQSQGRASRQVMPVDSPECYKEWLEPSWENISVSSDPVVKCAPWGMWRSYSVVINIWFPFFCHFELWSHLHPDLWKPIGGWEFYRGRQEDCFLTKGSSEWAILPEALGLGSWYLAGKDTHAEVVLSTMPS